MHLGVSTDVSEQCSSSWGSSDLETCVAHTVKLFRGSQIDPFPPCDDNILSSVFLFLFLGLVNIFAYCTDKLGQSDNSQTGLEFPFAHVLGGGEARLLLTIFK